MHQEHKEWESKLDQNNGQSWYAIRDLWDHYHEKSKISFNDYGNDPTDTNNQHFNINYEYPKEKMKTIEEDYNKKIGELDTEYKNKQNGIEAKVKEYAVLPGDRNIPAYQLLEQNISYIRQTVELNQKLASDYQKARFVMEEEYSRNVHLLLKDFIEYTEHTQSLAGKTTDNHKKLVEEINAITTERDTWINKCQNLMDALVKAQEEKKPRKHIYNIINQYSNELHIHPLQERTISRVVSSPQLLERSSNIDDSSLRHSQVIQQRRGRVQFNTEKMHDSNTPSSSNTYNTNNTGIIPHFQLPADWNSFLKPRQQREIQPAQQSETQISEQPQAKKSSKDQTPEDRSKEVIMQFKSARPFKDQGWQEKQITQMKKIVTLSREMSNLYMVSDKEAIQNLTNERSNTILNAQRTAENYVIFENLEKQGYQINSPDDFGKYEQEIELIKSGSDFTSRVNEIKLLITKNADDVFKLKSELYKQRASLSQAVVQAESRRIVEAYVAEDELTWRTQAVLNKWSGQWRLDTGIPLPHF